MAKKIGKHWTRHKPTKTKNGHNISFTYEYALEYAKRYNRNVDDLVKDDERFRDAVDQIVLKYTPVSEYSNDYYDGGHKGKWEVEIELYDMHDNLLTGYGKALKVNDKRYLKGLERDFAKLIKKRDKDKLSFEKKSMEKLPFTKETLWDIEGLVYVLGL